MRVLLTGGNGFLGSHIAKILLERGYDVRVFILKGSSVDTISGLPCEIFEGNLLNKNDLNNALDECDYLIHTAAITDVWPTKNKLSWKINYELIQDLVEIIRKRKIKKYIHIGTANSFGFGPKEKPGDEETPYNCDKYGVDYMDSKKAAQDFLLKESQKEDPLPVVIVNPTFMIGENDSKPGPGEMIISVIKRKVPAYASGGRSFAVVKDVALAAVNAIEKGKIGECYITGGTNLNYNEFFTLIGKITNVKPPKRKIATSFAVMFAGIVEFFAKIGKKKPLITREMAKISGDGHYYSSEKATREIGYVKTDLENALKEAINWYEEHGYIK